MNDTNILQAILDSVKKLEKDIKRVKEIALENGKRIEKLGKQLASVDDDAPSGEEFRLLEKRVTKIENKFKSPQFTN